MVVCSVPGTLRYRACSLAIAVAVQAENAARVQPQEHVMRQRGRRSFTRVLDPAPHLHLLAPPCLIGYLKYSASRSRSFRGVTCGAG